MCQLNTRHMESGFSLIEFLIALAVLGVAITPMLSGMVYSWQATIHSVRQSKAVMLGRWKEAMIRSADGLDVRDESRSECKLPAPYWSKANGNYSCEIITTMPSSTNPRLQSRRVDIRMYFTTPLQGLRTIECRNPDSCNTSDFSFYLTKPMTGSDTN